MQGFYDRCKELFDAGERAAFILHCRESMAASFTAKMGAYGLMHDDFVKMCQSPMGDWILTSWDGEPKGYMQTRNGITRWINSPVSKAA